MYVIPALILDVAAGSAVHQRYRLEYRRGEEFGRVRCFKNRGLLRVRMNSDARLIVSFKERGRTFRGDSDPELSAQIRDFLAGCLRC